MSRDQFFEAGGAERPIAPNAEAMLIADLCRVIANLGLGGNALDPLGGIPGGITDFRVGPNHGGPKPEALLVVRNLIGGLGNEERQNIRATLGDGRMDEALQLINAQNHNIQPNP